MNFLILSTLLIILAGSFIPLSFSENSSVTEYGFFGVEQEKYILAQGDQILVKISGIGEMPEGVDRERANITITNPDSTEDGHRVFSGNDGYFELLLPISYDSQVGVYKVFASFHGHILGEVYFTVERMSINDTDATSDSFNEETEHVFAFRTSMFEVETDYLSYEKDSIIHISGAVPTQPKLDLTLQIIDPMNNIILINQITPNPDGTFEDSVNTNSPLWKFEGDYNIRINHNEQDLYSTFSFSIPKNEIVVPNPIESFPEPPKIQEPEVIVEEPVIQNPTPVIPSPPPQQPTIQESDEFNPSGLIVLAIIFFIIAIIIKKKRGKKPPTQTQSQTYPSTSTRTDSQTVLIQSESRIPAEPTPTKIDDIKVAIEKIDSLIRRNKNKIAECNEELAYYRGPQGGNYVTKDAMVGYYQIRIRKLEDQNDDLSRIRGFCEEKDAKFAIEYLDIEISNNQEYINDNHDEVRSYELQNLDSTTTPIILEFLKKTGAEFQIEMNSCNEIKQILENFKNLKKTNKQVLITKFKSMPEKLDKRYSEIEKVINDNRNYYTSLEFTAAQKMLNKFKIGIDSAKNHIKEQTNDDLQMMPDDMIIKFTLVAENLIKNTDDALEEIKKHGSENEKTPERDESSNKKDKTMKNQFLILQFLHNKLLKKIYELEIELKDHSKFYNEKTTTNLSVQTTLLQLKTLELQVKKQIDEPNLIKGIDIETEKQIDMLSQLCDKLIKIRMKEENKKSQEELDKEFFKKQSKPKIIKQNVDEQESKKPAEKSEETLVGKSKILAQKIRESESDIRNNRKFWRENIIEQVSLIELLDVAKKSCYNASLDVGSISEINKLIDSIDKFLELRSKSKK